MAYPLLSFPQDLLLYPRKHPEMAVLILGTVIQLHLVLLLGKKLPVSVVEPSVANSETKAGEKSIMSENYPVKRRDSRGSRAIPRTVFEAS
jgi:hypothetical protein